MKRKMRLKLSAFFIHFKLPLEAIDGLYAKWLLDVFAVWAIHFYSHSVIAKTGVKTDRTCKPTAITFYIELATIVVNIAVAEACRDRIRFRIRLKFPSLAQLEGFGKA